MRHDHLIKEVFDIALIRKCFLSNARTRSMYNFNYEHYRATNIDAYRRNFIRPTSVECIMRDDQAKIIMHIDAYRRNFIRLALIGYFMINNLLK